MLLVYRDRLLKLAEFLENLDPERFNYKVWVGGNWMGREDLSCGTTACAFGWATTIAEFRELGLCLENHRAGGYICLKDKDGKIIGEEEEAAAHVFGLSESAYKYLFMPGHFYDLEALPPSPGGDASPSKVAYHIRRFVNWTVRHDHETE